MVIYPFRTNSSLNSGFVGHTQYLNRCDRLTKCKVKMARHVLYKSFLSFFAFLFTETKSMCRNTQKKMNRQEKVKERGECSVTLTEHARSLLLCTATTASILWDDLLCAFLV